LPKQEVSYRKQIALLKRVPGFSEGETVWYYVHLSPRSTGLWQTNGRTDRQIDSWRRQ